MARFTLAAARRAVRRLFCSASTAGEDEDAKTDNPPLAQNTSLSASARADGHEKSLRPSGKNDSADDAAMGDYAADNDKENVPPARDAGVSGLAAMLGGTMLGRQDEGGKDETVLDEDPEVVRVREENLRFIGEALEMARLALRTNETPVGCVLVREGTIIAKGMNATNVTRNGTRHAELMAISALLSVAAKSGPKTTCLRAKQLAKPADGSSSGSSMESRRPDEGNEDGSKGHLFPYGQKYMADERVDPDVLKDSVLYVTVEPCVMCASLLRQFGIRKVYFGAVNDKFGGTGGVFSVHANSLPVTANGQTASAHPIPRQQSRLPDSSGTLGTSYPPGGGDGGNVEHGYEIEGGWGRDEAVALLRRFYVQENGRAPVPRKKEGRAARLAAMMEKDGNASATSLVDGEQAGAAGGLSNGSTDNLKENVLPDGDANDEAKSDYDDDGDYLGVMEGEMRKGGFAAANLGL
ncbi:tRNA-specific adenosine deaminase subunit TAD2 [Tolypocladium ophioglossoides CBS 100239]|uniref:tRNA-specific adenosine deaminase subunit TAD2 n=1 Tax=Tolypocladium ophioglossoides (strain CBS 100239) TaxID=1163406 RepID=A0A0L0NF77_TOLOC|nr:tRNA-specific adenosine deaminase subunit TAD2 [Tolypocladium ophioglossoides CBS 100239]